MTNTNAMKVPFKLHMNAAYNFKIIVIFEAEKIIWGEYKNQVVMKNLC